MQRYVKDKIDREKEFKMTISAKWIRIRVTDIKTGKSKANVKIPASLAEFGMKMATRYASADMEGVDMNQIVEAAKNGSEGLLVDVEDEEKGEHVEIYVE